MVEPQDLLPPILGGDRLPFPQDLPGRGLEAVVLEAEERAASQAEAVEDDPPRQDRAGEVPGAAIEQQAPLDLRPAEVEGEVVGSEAVLQHAQVEVDHVPAGQHVRIERPQPFDQPQEQLLLAGIDAHHGRGPLDLDRLREALPRRRRGHEHLASGRAPERRGKDARPLRIGFEVEREDAQLRLPLRRP